MGVDKYYQNLINENGYRIDRPIRRLYFTTKEVGEIIGEVESTIRYWTEKFHIYRKSDDFKKQWRYPRESIAKLHIIKQLLREEHFTIIGAKIKLKQL